MSNLVTNPTADADNTIDGVTSDVVPLSANADTKDAVKGNSNTGAGGSFQSQDSYGVVGASLNESAGLFYSNASQNSKPTIVSLSIGGETTADHYQAQDENGLADFAIDKNGAPQLNPQGKSRPAASAAMRGKLWFVPGGTGVADQTQCCMKDASGNYSWVNL